MTQSKQELEDFYRKPDPWDYQRNEDDLERKCKILATIVRLGIDFRRLLDIAAGEAWITKDIPAKYRYGYELSDTAAARFPEHVKRVRQPEGKYDLVVATGCLYPQYDWPSMVGLIQTHASRIVLTCNIKSWEVQEAILAIPGKQIDEDEFHYRSYVQKLRVFDVSLPPDRPAAEQ